MEGQQTTCIICGYGTTHYFSKSYAGGQFSAMMREVGPVDYDRCGSCGFVLSRSHANLDFAAWSTLNHAFHSHLEDSTNRTGINQPPYAEQAMMLSMLASHGLIGAESMVDYAGGYGTLSALLSRYFGLRLSIYDPFVTNPTGGDYLETLVEGGHSTVINSAMFEHVRSRADLDAVHSAVASDGALVIHTVVCERVPPDPEWFYLAPPVHSAFHTNASMRVLMEQWGYRSSIYCPPAKSWTLLREPASSTAAAVAAINREVQSEWLLSRDGFVDYWKGF